MRASGATPRIATRLAVVAGDQAGHERPVTVRIEVLQVLVLRFERQVGPLITLPEAFSPGPG
jgi:hypothetical protein